jgi:hypothetical protein
MALREVADVDEHLAHGPGQRDRVDQRAGAGLLLVHGDRVAQAVRVPGGVGPALGDPREQRLRDERPVQP